MSNTRLLNIDCMEYMAGLRDNEFDLAIVDPPYGIGNKLLKNGPSRTKRAPQQTYKYFDNSAPPPEEYFRELERVSINQIIWGANHFAHILGRGSPCWVIWDKQTTGDFADCELAYTSFKRSAKKFTYQWNGMLQGGFGDKRRNEKRIHPTQKPVALYRWLLETFASPGQRVLDTHLGSGSSAIAAHYFPADFVGCEIDSDYLAAAADRFVDETRQETLSL